MSNFVFDLGKMLADETIDSITQEKKKNAPNLKTSNHINNRPNPTNFTLFNLSEILMKMPAFNAVADVMAKAEGLLTSGLGSVWDDIIGVIPGIGAIVPDGLENILNNFSDGQGFMSEGGDVAGNFAGGGKAAPPGSAAPTPGGNGGDWGGSMPLLLAWTNVVKGNKNKGGIYVSNNKRSTRNTKSGNMSDHYTGNNVAYAEDLFTTASSTDKAKDDGAIELCKALGKDYDGKSELVFNKTLKGYRYQILYRTWEGGNHFNHIHCGVKKVS